MSDTRRRDLARLFVGGSLASSSWLQAQAAGSSGAASPDLRLAQGTGPRGDAAASKAPRIGLALGSGSARGFAHIGVLKALDQGGIRPEVIVGSSAGALVGAFYAAGFTPWQIEEVALRVRDAEVADFASASKRGMLVGDTLGRFVNDILKGARIENLRTKYAAVTTDLRTGELAVLRSGPVADAVRASCSIPGVFIPRELGGRELVDGGLVSPLPVKTARNLGCDFVVAVDVGTRPHRQSLPGMYEVILQSFEIMGRALSEQESLTADLLVRPDTSQYASSDFNVRREMIQAGYEAGQRALPELKRRLDAPVRTRRG
ncbi:patatin-like phospholipase family protein [Ideonella sp. A 288]|uniref:patatin-like phospholipase family protein n=1 Tax=Ideonella sp. A 288 TaxID=1962181 RepID=UPI000B4B816B|nr:patatin-like phospholipase family protein [Ideonella sp. A 288]